MDIKIKNRLSKFLAACGIASRRHCEELIFAGKIQVNGEIAKLPQTLVNDEDVVLYQGKRVYQVPEKVYYMLHKPKGYLCSTKGNQNSRLVLDLFSADVKHRLFTVGRLDKDTQGLLLVTNDGLFANKVIHPSSNIRKEYVVKTDHEITAEHLKRISAGALIEGELIKPLSVKKVRRGTLKIVIGEGKKREVRLLLENAGLKTIHLTRIRIGGLQLGSLLEGKWRELSANERNLIFEL